MNLAIIRGYTDAILSIVNFVLVPILMAIALLTFFWGVYKYFILGADSDGDREKGRQFVLWGIIGFAVIVSVWGLVWIVGGTLLGPAGPGMNQLAPPPPTV